MNKLIAGISLHPDFKMVKQHFLQGDQDLLTGISGSQKTCTIAGLIADFDQNILIISYSNNQAFRMALDLEGLLGQD